MRRFFGVLALATLSGCAGSGMDEAECSTADWRTLGYEDGAAGADMNAFTLRRKACADHGVVADLNDYRAGRSEGLALFCRPSNAYNLGSLGVGYRGVCPPDLEKEFLAAYDDGYGLYQRQAALNSVTRHLNAAQSRADEVERLLAEKTAALAGGGLAPDQLAGAAVDIKQLAEERGRLARDIERLKTERAEADKAYRIYEARMASRASR
jgi:hypothetical protein